MKIINLNWQDLTPENITKLYLYGDLNNTHDLTSPKIHREGSSNDANSAQVTVKINNFYDYMTNPQSPLRYANLSQIPIVRRFFSEKRMYVHPKISPPMLPEGKYTLEQVQKHFQDNHVPTRLTYKYYGMQHMKMDPSSKDYAKRVYVFNSQGIHLGKGAVFVVQPNGERYIKNAAPTIASEDFDFVSSNMIANYGNNRFLIPNIDPHGIGRTVKISYPSYKDENTTEYTKYIHDYVKAHGNYTEEKFKKDIIKRYAHEHSPIKGFVSAYSAMNSVINDLWKSGITKFLDKEGNVIFYKNEDLDSVYDGNSNMEKYIQEHKGVKYHLINENSTGTSRQPEAEEKETKLQSCSLLSPEDMVPNAQIAEFDTNESIDEKAQTQENEKGAYLMENGILLSSGLNTTAAKDIKLATKNNEDDYGMEM